MTNRRGGKINSSLMGLKALETMKTTGNSISSASSSRKINSAKLPPTERLARLPVRKRPKAVLGRRLGRGMLLSSLLRCFA